MDIISCRNYYVKVDKRKTKVMIYAKVDKNKNCLYILKPVKLMKLRSSVTQEAKQLGIEKLIGVK